MNEATETTEIEVTTGIVLAAQEAAAKIQRWADDTVLAIEVLPLETPADEEAAAKFARAIRDALREAESERKALVEPLKKRAAEIDAVFRAPRTRLEELDRKLRTRIAEAETKRRRAAREAEERAAAALREAEKALEVAAVAPTRLAETDAVAKAREALDARAGALAEARAARETAPTGVHVRETLDFEVADLALVPRQFLALDERAVRAALRDAEKSGREIEIPGLRIVRKATTVIR